MIWWLLLYPIVGIMTGLASYRRYNRVALSHRMPLWFVAEFLVAWPIVVWMTFADIKELEARQTREHELLLERIRKEPDQQLADWDRAFNELAGIEEEPKQWRVGNPAAAAEYDRNMVKARSRSEAMGTRVLAPNESIFWYPPKQFSQGGRIPSTAELNKDFPVRQ